MKFLLIYWLTSSAQLVSAPPAILFNDEAACKAALVQIDDGWRGPPHGLTASYHASQGVCVAQAMPAECPTYSTDHFGNIVLNPCPIDSVPQ